MRQKLVRVGAVKEIKEGGSRKFSLRGGKNPLEGFVIRFQRRFYAYVNRCRHISLPLDWGDNDFFTPDGKFLVCKNHGALYLPDSGLCVGGPCAGSSLNKVKVSVKDGIVYVSREPGSTRSP